ncbi:hypothetical protein LC609_31360 [Nostoc sp. XA013]|nr:hypothetical protein [Nostoc sp. XA013]
MWLEASNSANGKQAGIITNFDDSQIVESNFDNGILLHKLQVIAQTKQANVPVKQL